MKQKIVLIGAGSSQFGFGTMGDIFQSETLRGSEVVLLDIDAEKVASVAKIGSQFIEDHDLPFTIRATTSRKEALAGAGFCIISIEVGNRFELWEQDWRVPQQFGIRQVFGENGGPGGLFHAARIVPPILEICEDIAAICPDAWVFNYSNPMSRICTTVTRKFPDLKFVGLCHEIASLPKHLPKILNLPWKSIEARAAGLNHFSAVLSVKHAQTGEDLYPALLAKAPAYFDQVPGLPAAMDHVEKTRRWPKLGETPAHEPGEWPERWIFKIMMDRFGVFPITTDSHFGEYIQWAHDAADHQGILDFYTIYKGHLSQIEAKIELKLKERVVPVIEGIISDKEYEEAAVNIPNKGLIPDLPNWLVLEVPAIVSANGFKGVAPTSIPKPFLGLLHNQVAVHDMTAEAILSRSKAALVNALMVDPVVDVYRPLEKLVDTMLELQPGYLGYFR
jgi:alpha-galactosidase/6-phospho-beta-glucosidase family protein